MGLSAHEKTSNDPDPGWGASWISRGLGEKIGKSEVNRLMFL